MMKNTKRDYVFIIKDNEGTVHGASLIKFKAVKIKENAEYDLAMSGSRNLVHIIKEKLL